jgi:hypothetical protein
MNEQEIQRRIIINTTLLYMLEHEKVLAEMLVIMQTEIAIFKATTGAGAE